MVKKSKFMGVVLAGLLATQCGEITSDSLYPEEKKSDVIDDKGDDKLSSGKQDGGNSSSSVKVVNSSSSKATEPNTKSVTLQDGTKVYKACDASIKNQNWAGEKEGVLYTRNGVSADIGDTIWLEINHLAQLASYTYPQNSSVSFPRCQKYETSFRDAEIISGPLTYSPENCEACK